MASPSLPSGSDTAALLRGLPDPVFWLSGPLGEEQLSGNPAAGEQFPLPEGAASAPACWAAFAPDLAAALQAAARQAQSGTASSGAAGGWAFDALPAEGGVWLRLRRAPAATAAEEQLDLLFTVFERLGTGLVLQDETLNVRRANGSAARTLGLSREQLRGQGSVPGNWELRRPGGHRLPPEETPTLRALRSGQDETDMRVGLLRPGAPHWRWLSVGALARRPADPWPPGVLLVLRDETAEQRVREELRRSEQRYRSLVQASAQIVWSASHDGEFRVSQPQWEAFTGQPPREHLGGGWLQAVHPDDREATLAAWDQAIERNEAYEVRHRLRRHDGVYVPMLARAVQVGGEAGQTPPEWIGTHSDVTLQDAAERALQTLNADLQLQVAEQTQEIGQVSRFMALLLTSAGEGIFGLDRDGNNTFVNPAASELLGYSVSELLGQPSHAKLHHHHADGTPHLLSECPISQTLRDGQQRRVEADVFWHRDGHPVPVAYVVTPTLDERGEVEGAVVMFQDVSEQVRAHAELEDALHHLQLTNADLEQFAYVASHDLQEPLRTLGSYAELLARRYQGQLDARADQYIAFMLDAVERMRSLIQDLLAFSRVGRNELELSEVTLDSLMQQTARNVEAALESSGGALTWDTPGTALAQPSLLVQLLTNLVSNGLKFARPGVPPAVEVVSSIVGNEQRIEVRDNGIGIGSEYHERVFTIFQRLHLREDYPGNGIGLAIARKIVAAHGGSLTLKSQPGEGSTFIISLPADHAAKVGGHQ
ncbi:PAS domain-containing sensor histidine kinase [Deinococcus radiodurans]|uniref:PAS domain-containing sensor histidine kinase n=1 Tax=Deinococcus radiodurans TaxID=1299 RepID=UPI000AB4378A|nr:PAS domain-containing sensor histidine kinase [Deinococcus radiodurans]